MAYEVVDYQTLLERALANQGVFMPGELEQGAQHESARQNRVGAHGSYAGHVGPLLGSGGHQPLLERAQIVEVEHEVSPHAFTGAPARVGDLLCVALGHVGYGQCRARGEGLPLVEPDVWTGGVPALMLLAYCGLRAGEVAALRLADVDWRRDLIRVCRAKTATVDIVPLLPAVGEALIAYLHTRSIVDFDELFLTVKAPIKSMSGAMISARARHHLMSAGVQSSKLGSHTLRHSLAVDMLQRAYSLKTIGDTLGHTHARSTFIYTKGSVEDLREVAQELRSIVSELHEVAESLADLIDSLASSGSGRSGPSRPRASSARP